MCIRDRDNKPIAFHSRKLNDAQTRCTTTERELLSIVETLKAYRNILLGHKIIVHTDHKNLVYKTFNTERVMRWRLLIEECGPEPHCIKGENNVIADTLSQLGLKEEELSLDAFALDAFPFGPGEEDLPEQCPLSFKQVAHKQEKNVALQAKLADTTSGYKIKKLHHSSHSCDITVNEDGKIVLPPALQTRTVEWHNLFLCHPSETRLEFTLRQHCNWRGLCTNVARCAKACRICKEKKAKKGPKCGKLPPKPVLETIPWHTLCIDLIGPHEIGKDKKQKTLHCLTMIDPATGCCLLYTSPSPRDLSTSRMPSSA